MLYHLTKLGWKDVCLLERSELTSGSTWHAAGGFHTLNADTNMAALQGYTIELYREIEQASGQDCGLHHVGGITLAATQDRMDFLRAERAKHRYMGLDTHLVTLKRFARCRRSPIPKALSVAYMIRLTVTSIPPAPPMPMPARRKIMVLKSPCIIVCCRLSNARMTAGKLSPKRAK